jgi:hypothetical protein
LHLTKVFFVDPPECLPGVGETVVSRPAVSVV